MRKNKVKPTKLQLKTLAIKQTNPDLSMRKAMIEAGYSSITASHPKNNLVEARGTEKAMEQFKLKLTDLGVTVPKMAAKYSEWLDATKIKSSLTEPDRIVPDYQTQLAVKDDVNKILGINSQLGNVKKRLTIEEFLTK